MPETVITQVGLTVDIVRAEPLRAGGNRVRHFYVVTAIDKSGQESPCSATVSAIAEDTATPGLQRLAWGFGVLVMLGLIGTGGFYGYRFWLKEQARKEKETADRAATPTRSRRR